MFSLWFIRFLTYGSMALVLSTVLVILYLFVKDLRNKSIW